MVLSESSFFYKYRLPSHDEIFLMAEKMCSALENEGEGWRPRDKNGEPGGLLDFTKFDVPVLLVPDLHARPDFLKNIVFFRGLKMDVENENKSVLELLFEKKIHVVFLGDALHSEKRTRDRWKKSFLEFSSGNNLSDTMKEEMTEGLSLLMQLYELKSLFPQNFHFLKGNHENVLNEEAGGDFPFRKYADEGRMVKNFISEYYGDDVLYMISWCEKKLPLVYAGKNCTASHAEPEISFTREEIINARLLDYVVKGLVWTPNEAACDGSVATIMNNLSSGKPWFSGHRPVRDFYSFRQNGSLIQIHNPVHQCVFLVRDSKSLREESFNPSKDIYSVEKSDTGDKYE